ncbi:hypothetical protein N802_04915 [Knoellia sinensis KCTC 19936]|uniref:FHA domain-containing protein n=1 Tax=Knoellia sinensis KCTC 19936 TaxID=1385520 RepID=A0A0A0J3D5_9MICO|nr:FHA domain-containing protein [Knoellia sinensis]KGN31204.1 hypothetical protein N802_04915 [Knoellia sinensis KCTC 19936]
MSSTEVTTQAPAGWVALSAEDRHLVVRGHSSLSDDLRGPLGVGLVAVLDALSRDGLGALPDFALVDTSGERARVLVRGSAVVRADGSEVSAEGRMPWRDVDVDAAVLEVAGSDGLRGGWRRPSRLGRPVVAAAAVDPEPGAVSSSPESAVSDEPAEPVIPAESDVEVAPEPMVEAALEPEPGLTPGLEPQPAPVAPPVPPADLTLPPSEEYAGAAPAERVIPEPESRPAKKVLIDSVPWRTLPDDASHGAKPETADQAESPSSQPAAAPAVPDAHAGPTGPDNWGMTGPPPGAAAPAAPGPAPVAPAPSAPGADTPVVDAPAGDAPAVEAPATPAPTPPPVPELTVDRGAVAPSHDGPADSPIVLAVICPAGHHSSPHASACRVCGRDLPTQQPFQTPRPQLGSLRVSTGGLVPLDRGILLGRSPKVNADLPPSSRPHLVRLASRDNDISRNHAEVILEGWHVLVRDLGSTNGTTVTLPGQEPVRLRPTEDFGIEPGAIITLADEVALTYEVSE